MKQSIRKQIKDFTDMLSLLDIEPIKNETHFKKQLKGIKDPHKLNLVLFSYLKYTVQSSAQDAFISLPDNWKVYLHECGVAMQALSACTSSIILDLAQIWNAPNMESAKNASRRILRWLIVGDMATTDESSIFRLSKDYSIFDSRTTAPSNSINKSQFYKNRQSQLDIPFRKHIYRALLELSLRLPHQLLLQETSVYINSLCNHSLCNGRLTPVFLYTAADILWKEDEHSSAAILYKQAAHATDHKGRLAINELLDVYNCWGLCEIELNNLSAAYEIYTEAIEKFDCSNKLKPLGYIYSNMAYVLGTLADNSDENEEVSTEYRDNAIKYIQKALDIDPNDYSSVYTSATLHYDRGSEGDLDKAYNLYTQVLDIVNRDINAKSKKKFSPDKNVPSLEISINEPFGERSLPKLKLTKLGAMRACLELHFEKKDNVSLGEGNILSLLSEYCNLYKDIRASARSIPDNDNEIEKAADVCLNYDLGRRLKNDKLCLCLLQIYYCAVQIRSCLRYDVSLDSESHKNIPIAYYTTLSNAKYLLNRTEPNESAEPNAQKDEWPDIPLMSNQAKNRLTMMHARYMNDPNEGNALIRALATNLEESNNKNFLFIGSNYETFRRKLLDKDFVFLKSFTSLVDHLSMWSTYASDRSTGSDSNGCCICIEPRSFQLMQTTSQKKDGSKQIMARNRDDLHLYRVAYIQENETIDENGIKKTETILDVDMSPERRTQLVNHYQNLKKLFEELNLLLKDDKTLQTHESLTAIWDALSRSMAFIDFLFKDAAYAAEKELRLICTRSINDNYNSSEIKKTNEDPPKLFIMPPYQIYVEKIILGPKVKAPDTWIPHLQLKLAEMWENYPESYGNHPIPKVRKSSISYRD